MQLMKEHTMKGNSLKALLMLAVSAPAAAQNTSPPPGQAPVGAQSGTPQISAKNGQTTQQQWTDRYQCDRWAVTQSGFDPNRADAASGTNAAGRGVYQRAFTACMDARGYNVRYGAPPTVPLPPAAPPTVLVPPPPSSPQLKYHPFNLSIEGGYTATTGTTNQALDGGSNVGLGFTWFPTSALPIGLRVDGSYSHFDAQNGLFNYNGTGYESGHVNLYGGDADLQLDLAHRSPGYKFYLFGGAGWYREQLRSNTVQYERQTICGLYYCAYILAPIVTGTQNSTSPWRNSWNAGLGWEAALADRVSFFIEARYQRIALPANNKLQFVPIQVGLRF
jgi:opacity protein-like surface antigen